MGSAVARRLLQVGMTVGVWNRRTQPEVALAEPGATAFYEPKGCGGGRLGGTDTAPDRGNRHRSHDRSGCRRLPVAAGGVGADRTICHHVKAQVNDFWAFTRSPLASQDSVGASAITIQGVPKRSVHMPKAGEKKV